MGRQQRPRLRQFAAVLATGAAMPMIVLAPEVASAEEPLVGRPFAPVVEGVVEGDLLLAGNSNLLSAGGWRDASLTAADVDRDATRICIRRDGEDGERPSPRRPLCADNSSSADLDLPDGARVIAARLYVETSVSRDVGSLRVMLDGPSDGFSYRMLPATSVPARLAAGSKLYEAVGDDGEGAVLRHAVWDVTGYVAAAGAGSYTVADIVNERVGPWLPYASWAMVVAYERDPGFDGSTDGSRFARRLISWHDGFQHVAAGSLDVPIRGLDPATATFGKSFHVVARGRGGRSDNLLFDSGPLGNNAAPDDAPPPAGVVLGDDPDCNTVTDVQNDSICVLGTNVDGKSPGATDFRSSADGATRSSGSGVDIDVIRIPDRSLRASGPEAVVQVLATGRDTLAPGMVAVSIDVERGDP